MIATKNEIKNLVFGRNFDINKVKDNIITLVELEQVKPLLGTTLFDLVVALPDSYTDLLALLKPFIAYHTKYYISEGNHKKTGNKGVQVSTGTNETPSTAEDGKSEALTFANKYKRQIITYLKDNNLSYDSEDDNIINNIIIL